MPTYEYLCASCHHEFSAKQRMSEPRLEECPACKQVSLQRVIGAAGFALKGGGWYQTDFKASAPKTESAPPKADGVTPPAPEKSSAPGDKAA